MIILVSDKQTGVEKYQVKTPSRVNIYCIYCILPLFWQTKNVAATAWLAISNFRKCKFKSLVVTQPGLHWRTDIPIHQSSTRSIFSIPRREFDFLLSPHRDEMKISGTQSQASRRDREKSRNRKSFLMVEREKLKVILTMIPGIENSY